MFSQKILKIILVFSIIGFSLNTNLVHLDTLLSLNTVNYTEIEQKKKCISEALYYEARGEGERGMRYVLSVIHNRKNAKGFPDSYCKVIHQPKQFSYRNHVSPGLNVAIRPIHPGDKQSYLLASAIAEEAVYGRFETLLPRDVLWYHTDEVKPRWAKAMQKIKSVAGHHFLAKRKD